MSDPDRDDDPAYPRPPEIRLDLLPLIVLIVGVALLALIVWGIWTWGLSPP